MILRLITKKAFVQKNPQKYAIPRKMSDELMSYAMYPSKNVILGLF
jgi:hypothetical protein